MQDNGLTLYRRFLRGDEGGLEALITLYQRGLLRFIYGYVRDLALAEDIFTDVFLTLYYSKHPFREQDGASLKTYLYKIARNKSLNALRKRRRRREISLDALAENGAELYHTASPELSLEKSEQTEALQRALQALPQNYREVLVLRYFEELSPETIAKITKRNVKQVYNLLARGKAAMKEKLRSEDTHYENA